MANNNWIGRITNKNNYLIKDTNLLPYHFKRKRQLIHSREHKFNHGLLSSLSALGPYTKRFSQISEKKKINHSEIILQGIEYEPDL